MKDLQNWHVTFSTGRYGALITVVAAISMAHALRAARKQFNERLFCNSFRCHWCTCKPTDLSVTD